MSDEDSKAEIVIVRRRGGDDGGAHKGGAWKIAYADFVTAMMAFFLVMWLINASNEETRAQVASYFNPIKLTDTTTGERSLKDMKEARDSKATEHKDPDRGSPPARQDIRSEAELLANPPKSLDRIARTVSEADFRNAGLENDVEVAPALKPDRSNPGIGDPFDPQAWEKVKTGAEAADASLPGSDGEGAKQPPSPPVKEPAAKDAEKPSTEVPQKTQEEAAAIARDIAAQLGKDADTLKQSLEVKATGAGVLISLTEHENFEMFETGSAEPRPEALRLVEAIAAALKSREGFVVIRGHTDSRPYRNKYYDNWQLSTARAHFARYMLARGGLAEQRIRRVEGVADREPRNAQDPQAAENRRIEILLGREVP